MRLGTKLMIAGLVISTIGLAIGPTTTTTETRCEGGLYTERYCYEAEVEEPSLLGPSIMAIGGFLFGGGWGGWVGCYDAENRMRRRESERSDEPVDPDDNWAGDDDSGGNLSDD